MVITSDWIEKNSSGVSGWTRRQLDIIRVNWPPRKGWKSWAVGQEIPDESAREFERIGAELRAAKMSTLFTETW